MQKRQPNTLIDVSSSLTIKQRSWQSISRNDNWVNTFSIGYSTKSGSSNSKTGHMRCTSNGYQDTATSMAMKEQIKKPKEQPKIQQRRPNPVTWSSNHAHNTPLRRKCKRNGATNTPQLLAKLSEQITRYNNHQIHSNSTKILPKQSTSLGLHGSEPTTAASISTYTDLASLEVQHAHAREPPRM